MNQTVFRCAITDRRVLLGKGAKCLSGPDLHRALGRQAAALAADGVDLLQLREKDLPPSELAALARMLLDTLRGSRTRLLINSRADVAVAVAANGVHLTSSSTELTPTQVCDLYSAAGLPAPAITVACHSLEDVVRHRLEPVTALLFGPVFEKSVAGDLLYPGSGLGLLHEAALAAAPVPILALGGVTLENSAACIAAGASGFAGIRLFYDSSKSLN